MILTDSTHSGQLSTKRSRQHLRNSARVIGGRAESRGDAGIRGRPKSQALKGQQGQSAEEGKTSWLCYVWCFCRLAMETREPGAPEEWSGQTTSMRAIEANTVACQ